MTDEELLRKRHQWNNATPEAYQRRRAIAAMRCTDVLPIDFDEADKPFKFNAQAYISRYGTYDQKKY